MRFILYLMIALNVLTFGWFSYKETFLVTEKGEFQAVAKGVKQRILLNERGYINNGSARIHNKAVSVGMCHTIGPLKHRDSALDIVAELPLGLTTSRSRSDVVTNPLNVVSHVFFDLYPGFHCQLLPQRG